MLGSIITYSFSRIASGLLFFATTFIYVHALEATDYGVLAVAVITAQTISLLSVGWIWYASSRFMAGLDDQFGIHRLGTLVICVLTCSFATLILMMISASLGVFHGGWRILLPASLFAVGFGLNEFLLTVFNARRQLNDYLAISIARYGLGFVFGAVLVAGLGYGAEGALWGMALGAWVSLMLPAAFRTFGSVVRSPAAWSQTEFRRFVGSGWPAVIVFGIYSFAVFTNRFVLNALGGSEAAGQLAGVSDLTNGPVVLLFQVINLAFVPQIYAAANLGDHAGLRASASHFLGVQFMVAVAGLVALLMLGPELSMILIGDSLGSGSHVLFSWVGIFSILVSLFGIGSALLIAIGRLKTAIGLTLGTLALNALGVWLAQGDVLRTAVASDLALLAGACASIGVTMVVIGYRLSLRELGMIAAAGTAVFVAIHVHRSWLITGGPVASLALAVVAVGLICLAFDVLDMRTTLERRFRVRQIE